MIIKVGVELHCGKTSRNEGCSRAPSRLNTAFFKTPGNLKCKTQRF